MQLGIKEYLYTQAQWRISIKLSAKEIMTQDYTQTMWNTVVNINMGLYEYYFLNATTGKIEQASKQKQVVED